MGWRTVLGIVAGAVAGTVLIMLLEWVAHMLFPVTADVTSVDALPIATKLAIVVTYLIASFAGGAVAAWVGRTAIPAIAVGVLLLALGIWNMTMIPHPMWMAVANGLALLVPAVLAGYWFAPRGVRPAAA